jgi:hypothetical protein
MNQVQRINCRIEFQFFLNWFGSLSVLTAIEVQCGYIGTVVLLMNILDQQK